MELSEVGFDTAYEYAYAELSAYPSETVGFYFRKSNGEWHVIAGPIWVSVS